MRHSMKQAEAGTAPRRISLIRMAQASVFLSGAPSGYAVGRGAFPFWLDEMHARGCRVKSVGEILRLVGHQSFAKFHDAHRVRWYSVVGKYEFSDPEIAAADNSPDRKTLLVGLN